MKWGLSGEKTIPFFTAIRIYSLHQRKFTEYVLINPIIRSFKFGEHNNADSSNLMQAEMSIEYETVVYGSGAVSKTSVHGFASLQYYDNGPSPMAGFHGSGSLLGPIGSLNSTAESFLKNVSDGNLLGTLSSGQGLLNQLSSGNLANIGSSITSSLIGGNNPLNGNPLWNPQSGLSFPTLSSVTGSLGGITGLAEAGSSLFSKGATLISTGASKLASLSGNPMGTATNLVLLNEDMGGGAAPNVDPNYQQYNDAQYPAAASNGDVVSNDLPG